MDSDLGETAEQVYNQGNYDKGRCLCVLISAQSTTESLQDAIEKQRRHLKPEGPKNYLAAWTCHLPPFHS